MKQQPANKNKPTSERELFLNNLFLQKYIRKYVHSLHLDQVALIYKKFEMIEESLKEEIKTSLEKQSQLFRKKQLMHKTKALFPSVIFQLYKIIETKRFQFWKALSLKLPLSDKELTSLLVLLGLISFTILGSLFNHPFEGYSFQAPQFLMTLC